MKAETVDWMSSRARAFAASEIRELLKLLHQPEIISFAGGVPDPNFFPTENIMRSVRELMAHPDFADRFLQYAVSEGSAELRAWLAHYMGRQAAKFTEAEILITNGAQQALDFAGRLLLDEGAGLVVCEPTYLGALQVFSHYQPSFLGVQVDTSGPLLNDLEAAFKKRPRAIYLNPNAGNPDSVTISRERRVAILSLAKKYDVTIIEDGAYDELYFEQPFPDRLITLARQLPEKDRPRIMYCGTFSKTIAPALRIGWICAERPIVEKAVLMKQATDLHCNPLSQELALRHAVSNFDSHNEFLRRAYKARRDTMCSSLRTSLPNSITFEPPDGGFFLWLTLPDSADGKELLQGAISSCAVAFVPGEAFYWNRARKNNIRLSFSAVPEERIQKGSEKLAAFLTEHFRR